jgi:hypothetical protein
MAAATALPASIALFEHPRVLAVPVASTRHKDHLTAAPAPLANTFQAHQAHAERVCHPARVGNTSLVAVVEQATSE